MSIHESPVPGNAPTSPLWETAWNDPKTPANIDAERALLGALLISNRSLELVTDLKPEHFHAPLHGEIFRAISEAIMRGGSATATSLAPKFKAQNVGHKLNGAQYLGSLIVEATTTMNVRAYAQHVIEMAQRRTLIVVGEEIVARAYDTSEKESAAEIVEVAEQMLFSVSTRGQGGQEVSLKDASASAIKAALRAHKLGGRIDGIETGLIDLDKALGGGFGNSDLVVLGGRPSMGKTALATKIALNVARGVPGVDPDTGEIVRRPRHVHFFSLEMSGEQLASRLLSDLSGVPSNLIRLGKFDENQLRAIMDADHILNSLPMTIEQTGGISIGALSAKARREKRKNGTGLIVVDYLQLMQAASSRGGNRVQEITEITVGLKALAKELGVPLLALSQLSRGLERNEDKRPQLSDLRESGSIEQDADVVLFVYREEYYWLRKNPKPTSPDITWEDDFEKVHGKADVIIGKQRHGEIGTVALAFDGSMTRFDNLARGPQ